jgi:hypothetical protein
MCPRRTRSCGNTLPLFTRTRTKASRVAARIDVSQPCPRLPLPIHHRTLLCRWPQYPEATADLSTSTAANAAAGAPPCHPTAFSESTADTTSMFPCLQDITSLLPVDTMTWCSLSASYTKRCATSVFLVLHCVGPFDHSLGVVFGISALVFVFCFFSRLASKATGDQYPS